MPFSGSDAHAKIETANNSLIFTEYAPGHPSRKTNDFPHTFGAEKTGQKTAENRLISSKKQISPFPERRPLSQTQSNLRADIPTGSR